MIDVILLYPGQPKHIRASWYDIVRLYAAHRGYSNVDVEPWAGKVNVTVTGDNLPTVERSGPDAATACQKVIDALG